MDKDLFEAARDGDVELVKRFLAQGTNTEWKNKVSEAIFIFIFLYTLMMMLMNDHFFVLHDNMKLHHLYHHNFFIIII